MIILKLTDFYYDLPKELIAQHPLEHRDDSRLLVVNKNTGELEHSQFKKIVNYLNKGDCLVLNDTRVIPARLLGINKESGGKMEFLLLKRIKNDVWETLAKPGRRATIGSEFIFGQGELTIKVLEIKEDGSRIVELIYEGIFEEVLDALGQMPLPPYIKEQLEDNDRYQTIYSKERGSAAAPTAGLHFTRELLSEIRKKGVEIAFITLHVGIGTFRPVKEVNIEDHDMHSEFYIIDLENAEKINTAKRNGGKIVAVGTTSSRTLETVADAEGIVSESSGWTDIFIYPGYSFKIVDALITNFHLPESTLIMLVSALSNREIILNAYNIAIKNRYRFFSFGDAMLIK